MWLIVFIRKLSQNDGNILKDKTAQIRKPGEIAGINLLTSKKDKFQVGEVGKKNPQNEKVFDLKNGTAEMNIRRQKRKLNWQKIE